jgi:hypothetical protein
VPEQRPGDCYVWGGSEPLTAVGPSSTFPTVCNSQHSALPTIVNDSNHLDVCQVPALFLNRFHF